MSALTHEALAIERMRLMAAAPPAPLWFEPAMPAGKATDRRLETINRLAQWPVVYADIVLAVAATTSPGELMRLCGLEPTTEGWPTSKP